MSRLPKPGSDNNQWGSILNDYLSVEHTADGTLKKASIIADAKAKADSAVQKVNNKTGDAQGAVALDAADVGAIPTIGLFVNSRPFGTLGDELLSGLEWTYTGGVTARSGGGFDFDGEGSAVATTTVALVPGTLLLQWTVASVDPTHSGNVSVQLFDGATEMASYGFGSSSTGHVWNGDLSAGHWLIPNSVLEPDWDGGNITIKIVSATGAKASLSALALTPYTEVMDSLIGALKIDNDAPFWNSGSPYNPDIGLFHDDIDIRANTTQSIGIGSRAMANIGNQSPAYCTAFGSSALEYLSAGAGHNTGIGNTSLQNTTTGARNTGIGVGSAQSNTTGNSTTAIGFGTLRQSQDGDENSALGYYAGDGDSTGTTGATVHGIRNTFLGARSAPTASADPDYATAIGYGVTVGGSGSVAIGANSDGTKSATATEDNQMVLGTDDHTVEVPGTLAPTSLVLASPNGTKYKVTVADDGTLSAVAA